MDENLDKAKIDLEDDPLEDEDLGFLDE